MWQISDATSRYMGTEFCKRLVEQIAKSFGYRYVFIAIPSQGRTTRLRTVAFWSGSELIDNFAYELTGAPCEKVMERGVCFFPDGVQNRFPNDRTLRVLGASSYLGIPLTDCGGNVIGILAMCDVRAMEDCPQTRYLLAMLADRATVELQRWSESEARQKSEAQVRLLTEQAPVGLWTIDRDLIVTHMVGGAIRAITPETETLVGKSLFDLFRTTDTTFPAIANHLRALAGEENSYEIRWRNRLFQARLEPLRDHDNEIVGVAGVAFDVTDLQQAQQSLIASENRFRRLVEYAPESVTLFDIESGKFVMANAAATKLFGYSEQEFLNLNPSDLSPPTQPDGRSSRAKAMEWIDRACRGGMEQFDWVHCDREGRQFQCEVSLLSLQDNNRTMIRGSVLDVSQRRRAEDKLRAREAELAHVARISTMGEMVGGVAHELNQPLYAIQNFAKACEKLVGSSSGFDRDQLCEWMERIGSTAQYAGHVLTRLRNFVQQAPMNRSAADLHEIVDTALMLTHFEARRRRVQIQIDLAKALPKVDADAVQIQQVLVNLIRNAFEATGELFDQTARIVISAQPLSDVVRVQVRDNGRGLPADEFQIFDAFTSTKSGGMGLGLAIAKTIAEAHGGTLIARRPDGRGALFEFTLKTANQTQNRNQSENNGDGSTR